MTECPQSSFESASHYRRPIEADFTGPTTTSEGDALLLRQTAMKVNLMPRVAACFQDGRDQRYVRHGVEELVSQRIYGLALGYEDLNDHDQWRHDPL